MIVVQLMGGLGNQMFQYAIGRSLAAKNKTSLKLDTAWFKEVEDINTQRQYDLGCYPIKAKLTVKSRLKLADQASPTPKTSLANRLLGKPLLRVQSEQDTSFHPEILSLPDDVYLQGYWQNEKYFIDIRPQLIKEFIPRELSNYSKQIMNKIRQEPSISLHVRRGDYVNNPLTNKYHGLTPVQYYVKGLEYIQERDGGLRCFVFSDDVEWCKANLPFAKTAIFVSGNKPDRACEDMYLMKLCDHNIIANSSFSWWGAWLNENPNKVVVAPKVWFQDKAANKAAQIVPESWHRL